MTDGPRPTAAVAPHAAGPYSLLRWARSRDRALAERSAGLHAPNVDTAMRTLSRAADHGVLWWGVAGGVALFGTQARRGAVRGLVATALTSAVANGLLKPVFPRRRPPARIWRNPRRGVRMPTSSSFPSGHAASAAAFATGVALESPLAGAVVAPLAAAVAYSRVHNGVHWPSDVAVGAAVGAGIAIGTRRWWAVRSDDPAELGPQRDVPALPDGAGLLVLDNSGAGTASEIMERVRSLLPAATVVDLGGDEPFGQQFDAAIRRERPQAIGVCGGDGTVAAAAAAAVRHDLPLAVFAGGTLNHFARDAGATNVTDVAEAVTAGTALAVDLAEVRAAEHPERDENGNEQRLFVNTASLGGYPDAVRLRQRWEPRLGKWTAAALAMARVLRTAEPLHVTIDGRPTACWMLFVGNGRYSPGDQVPMNRPAMSGGVLDLRYLRADRRLSRTRLLGAALTGTLGTSRVYERNLVPAVAVTVASPSVALATDGEADGDATAFEFRSCPRSLTVYRALPG